MDLPRFERGQPNFAWKLQQLADAIRANTPLAGAGLRIASQTSAGVMLAAEEQQGGSGGSAAKTYHPFQIIEGYPADPAYPVLRINGQSVLWKNPQEYVPITGDPGLGAVIGSATDDSDDPGQFALPAVGRIICLQVEFTPGTLEVVSCKVELNPAGSWVYYPNPVQMADSPGAGTADEFRQRYLWIPIAEVVESTDARQGTIYTEGTGGGATTRKVVQLVDTNLSLHTMAYNGTACVFAAPHFGYPGNSLS